MRYGDLPEGLELRRTTPEFDAETVPAGLLSAHQVAAGVWGLLEVTAGSVVFVREDGSMDPVELHAGDSMVIPPEAPHHVEPGADARFHVSFHR